MTLKSFMTAALSAAGILLAAYVSISPMPDGTFRLRMDALVNAPRDSTKILEEKRRQLELMEQWRESRRQRLDGHEKGRPAPKAGPRDYGSVATTPGDGLFGFDPYDDEDDEYGLDINQVDPYASEAYGGF